MVIRSHGVGDALFSVAFAEMTALMPNPTTPPTTNAMAISLNCADVVHGSEISAHLDQLR